ncbi:MAG: exodeoxyribonuclease III [Atribacterota bacterium]|nr:exodeoxyribonuclease III [Atribacterota bacterium]MDD3640228.1 exodeoxyribonuclease III [Atribacterota bacterium]MDD4288245.1 exodeoxyribonuclease III [Atribacterota bacterium]MDD5635149.1 exodeoxyribonuclease III [Atribacterota bacterium]
MRLLSWNVNGLRAIYKKNFLDWFNKEDADIFCIQETKSHKEQLPKKLIERPGYHSYFAQAERKGYSGVGLWSKIIPERVSYELGLPRFDNEGRLIETEYNDFTLFNVYFPNGKASKKRLQYKMDYYETFLKRMSDLLKEDKKIVICGDVNTAHQEIDLARPKENEKVSGFLPVERQWIDRLIDIGFIDTFRYFEQEPGYYSWWDYKTRARERNVGWRIDYFFVSKNLINNLKSAFIQSEVMGSDHCPIGIDLIF